MGCPECKSDDISESGICLACGYVTSISTTEREPESVRQREASEFVPETESSEFQRQSGLIEVDYSEGEAKGEQEDDKPKWRQELSQRLQAIKQKREAMGPLRQAQSKDKYPLVASQRTQTALPSSSSASASLESVPAYKPVFKPKAPQPRQKTLQPLNLVSSEKKQAPREEAPRDVQTLIDNAVSGKSAQTAGSDTAAGYIDPGVEIPSDDEGKLILLSRTLSGLVDLIIISLCSGACILAADFFSGIIALDAVSCLIFSVLFLLTYFLYSLFFLSASNQTIGMMITDLRVVDVDDRRPSVSQLLRRCFGYLASVLILGFGLLWSLFDRESQCFHDRISDTRVIRIQ